MTEKLDHDVMHRRVVITVRSAARLAAPALLAVLVVSCSAHSAAKPVDFTSGYLAAERSYRTEFGALQTQARTVVGKDVATQLTVFTKMTDATGAALQEMRALTPPADLKPRYEQLLVALDTQKNALAQIADSARANDQARLNQSLTGFASSLQDGISLLRQIDDAINATAK
jgi:hypothetical protein